MTRGSCTTSSVLVLIAVLSLEITCSNPQAASGRACLGRGMLPSWTWKVLAPGEDAENSGGEARGHESRRRPHQNPNHQPCHSMLRLRGGKGSWRGKQSGARVGLDGVAHLVNHLRERGEIPAAPNRGSGPGGEETQQGAAPHQTQRGMGGGRDAEGDVIGEENEEDEAMLRQVLEPAKAPDTSPAPARSAEAEPFMGTMHPSRMINTVGAAASAPRPETMSAGQVHPSRAHNVGVGLPDGHPPPLNSPYHQQPDPSPRGGDWSSRRVASRRGKEFANREKARQFFEADIGDDKPQWPSFPPSEEMWSVPEDCQRRWERDDGEGAMNADDGDGTVTYMHGDEIAPEHEKEVIKEMCKRVVFVKNLPKVISIDEVKELFDKYGEVAEIRLGDRPDVKGTAYVVYQDERSVRRAVRELTGQKVGEKYLILQFHNPEKMRHVVEASGANLDLEGEVPGKRRITDTDGVGGGEGGEGMMPDGGGELKRQRMDARMSMKLD